MTTLAYPSVLLKLSGEALAGDKGQGLDFPVLEGLADAIKEVHAMGVRLALVVGGGNIIRGTTASKGGLDRVSADYMGMLATVINALALQDVLEKKGVDTLIDACIESLPGELRETAFAKACDLVRADGVVEADEKEFINNLCRKLEIDRKVAGEIAEIMVIKNKG